MDAVVEVDMQGNVVWEWCFFDHVVQDVDAAKANYVGAGKAIKDYPGRININMPDRPLKRDWLHCNSMDYNAESGHIGSSGQRLPNGGTFICSDTEGHFFEVTSKGELAWEYINPVTRDGPVKVLNDALPMVNSAFRAYRYAADHPAFKGRDLTPKGTIIERATQGLDIYPKRRPEGDRPRAGGERRVGNKLATRPPQPPQ